MAMDSPPPSSDWSDQDEFVIESEASEELPLISVGTRLDTGFTLRDELLEEKMLCPTPFFKAWHDWGAECCPRYQPGLTLLSCISTLSLAMGRTIVGPTGLKQNVYLMGLAGSTHGKEAPRLMAQHALESCGLGHKIGSTTWGSVDGMRRELAETHERIWLRDEMAGDIRKWRDDNTAAATRDVQDNLLMWWGGGKDYGKGIKDKQESEKTVLESPYPVICGFAQPQRFWTALHPSMIESGIVGRFLILHASILRVEDVSRLMGIKDPGSCMPSFIKDHLLAGVRKAGEIPVGPGEVEAYINGVAPTKKMVFASGAREYWLQVMQSIEMDKNREERADLTRGTVRGREGEKLCKLAAICAWSRDYDKMEITCEDIDWALSLVKFATQDVFKGMKLDVPTDSFEKKLSHAVSILRREYYKNPKRGTYISRLRQSLRMEPRKFTDLIVHLVHCELVSFSDDKKTRLAYHPEKEDKEIAP